MKRIVLILVSFFLLVSVGYAQSDAGKLKGKVTDEAGEPVPYATVKIINNGIVTAGANTDDEGNYSIYPIKPATYSIIVTFAGQEKRVDNVEITPLKTKTVDIQMKADVQMEEVKIYAPIEFDQTTSIETFNKDQVRQSGYRDINAVVAIAAGAVPNDRSGGVNMRGGRSNATTYFVDGVKMRGVVNMPQKSIEQINVIVGGTPAGAVEV